MITDCATAKSSTKRRLSAFSPERALELPQDQDGTGYLARRKPGRGSRSHCFCQYPTSTKTPAMPPRSDTARPHKRGRCYLTGGSCLGAPDPNKISTIEGCV